MNRLLLKLFLPVEFVILIVLSSNTGAAQAPANDECTGATVVTSLPYNTSQDTRLATPNGADPALPCAQGGGGKSVWFQYVADSTRQVTFSSEGSQPNDYDPAMGLFTGSCGSLTLVACNDDIIQGVDRAAEIRFTVQSGTTYYLLVAEWNGGGPSGGVPTGGDLLFRVCSDTCPLLVLPVVRGGPKAGS